MKFTLEFHPLVDRDVQEAITYYNSKKEGLGSIFYKALKVRYKSLKTNPFFQIRYQNIRCLPMKKFPYMIHFTLDEDSKTVFIEGVFNTSLNPDDHWPLEK
jgi:hypothetical protein